MDPILDKARAGRRSIVAAAHAALESGVRTRTLVAARVAQLQGALATARSVRASMEGAARQGGASQLDVLLARRAHQELLLDEKFLLGGTSIHYLEEKLAKRKQAA